MYTPEPLHRVITVDLGSMVVNSIDFLDQRDFSWFGRLIKTMVGLVDFDDSAQA